MIIFGTRGVNLNRGEGAFHCPACSRREHYKKKHVRRFFTLYFIPMIPLDRLAEFVECQNCKNAFEVCVLECNPEVEQQEFRTQWQRAMLKVMIRVMMADGRVDEKEVSIIRQIYGSLTEATIKESEILTEIPTLEASAGDVRSDLEPFVPMLNEHGKEMMVRAVLAVASADGEFQEEEKELLAQVARVLKMSAAHVNGILQSAARPSQPDQEL